MRAAQYVVCDMLCVDLLGTAGLRLTSGLKLITEDSAKGHNDSNAMLAMM